MQQVFGNKRRRKRESNSSGVDPSVTAQTRQPTVEGAPCRRCSSTLRLASDGRCVRCLRQWRRDNEPRYYRKWGSALFRKLGLTVERFYEMCEDQDWRCAICKRIPENTLHVDHDHETGEIRGLLCGGCNVGLGHFGDNPETLAAAIKYLRP